MTVSKAEVARPRKRSAGILLYRRVGGALEVFLVHPGGPLWAGRDQGAWSIPKGECREGEDPLAAARREFHEETGFAVEGAFRRLSEVRQPGGKLISAWGVEGDCDPLRLRSNTFSMEWPPRSGRRAEFPEIDRGGWFSVADARKKIAKGQVPIVDELRRQVGEG